MTKRYEAFDIPEILSFLFHPRKEGFTAEESSGIELSIPVSDGVNIGGKLFSAKTGSPLILFFHGNGEIVSDYDDLGPIFVSMGISFMPVDYRGYGRSGGSPSVSAMISDAHKILDFTRQLIKEKDIKGPLIIMGRSLGSASALELAAERSDEFEGLIIESGFAFALPLLELLGIRPSAIDISEEEGFDHITKVKKYSGPLLIIHAEYDHIIPHSDGEALYEESVSSKKKMVTIESANHNNIFLLGMDLYMNSIKNFVKNR